MVLPALFFRFPLASDGPSRVPCCRGTGVICRPEAEPASKAGKKGGSCLPNQQEPGQPGPGVL